MKRAASLLLALCLLLSAAGCKSSMPNLEAYQILDTYSSLIGKEKAEVYAQLGVSESNVVRSGTGFLELPDKVTIDGIDFTVRLDMGREGYETPLAAFRMTKVYTPAEADIATVASKALALSEALKNKYGEDETYEHGYSDDMTSFAGQTKESIMEALSAGKEVRYIWGLSETLNDSVKSFLQSLHTEDVARTEYLVILSLFINKDGNVSIMINHRISILPDL